MCRTGTPPTPWCGKQDLLVMDFLLTALCMSVIQLISAGCIIVTVLYRVSPPPSDQPPNKTMIQQSNLSVKHFSCGLVWLTGCRLYKPVIGAKPKQAAVTFFDWLSHCNASAHLPTCKISFPQHYFARMGTVAASLGSCAPDDCDFCKQARAIKIPIPEWHRCSPTFLQSCQVWNVKLSMSVSTKNQILVVAQFLDIPRVHCREIKLYLRPTFVCVYF